MLFPFRLALPALCLVVSAAPAALGQCTKDTDCKGDRVCVNGTCVEPPSSGGRPSAPAAPAERSPAASAPTTTAVRSESSLDDLAASLHRDLPGLGSDRIVTTTASGTWVDQYEIRSATLSGCRLTIVETDEMVGVHTLSATRVISLKDVDLSKLSSSEVAVRPGQTLSKPSYRVKVEALPDRGKPFLIERTQSGKPGAGLQPTSSATVRVRDQDAADRVATLLRDTALLCGAPNQSQPTTAR